MVILHEESEGSIALKTHPKVAQYYNEVLSSSSSSPIIGPQTPDNDCHQMVVLSPNGHSHHHPLVNHQNQIRPSEDSQTMVALEFPLIHSSSSSRRTHEEEIYEDLCYVTLRLGRERYAPHEVLTLEPVEKRDYCIKELLETEKNYTDALNMIINHFMNPLKKVLNQEDRHVIFLNIKCLADVHSKFYSDLCKACGNHSSSSLTSSSLSLSPLSSFVGSKVTIPWCFLNWKDKFVIYGDYCSNLPHAQQLIDDLCSRDDTINQSVARCQLKANDGKFKLRDLLSLPMQRILKYHLLLSELIKCTVETHDDHSGLERAYESMVDLGQYINEVKRDSETLQIISDIQSSIIDLDMPMNTLLKDYGRLLKDGEIKLRSYDDSRIKNRYIFVFDKVMLMCKSIRGEQYSYKEALILADYQIEDIPPLSTISKLTKQLSNGWYLVHRQNKTSYTFYAKTDDLKRKWMDAIEKALDNVCPLACREGSTDHTFAMYTFDTPTYCSDCDKLLQGIFFQGYQCTVCQIAVHKHCIAKVRSCGAPSLPPRPPLPPSSPGVSINSFSGEEDNLRNSVCDLRRRTSLCHVKALGSFDGDTSIGQLSFMTDDVVVVTSKCVNINLAAPEDDAAQEIPVLWWEGRNLRTGDDGTFPSSMVTECDSYTIDGQPTRVSYEDPNSIFGVLQPSPCDPNLSLNLEDFPWFAGAMERDRAHATLDHLPNGSFLVRVSPKQNGFAISLNYNGQVKHMRVCVTNTGHYYLSESRYFKSIVDLVQWYETNSLCESFNLVNTSLMIPFKKSAAIAMPSPIAYAIAVYSFTVSSSNLLSLKKGDRVAILSKAGEGKGWWKGQIDDRIGYFPLAYVNEIKDYLCN